jgi:hypothetical protein
MDSAVLMVREMFMSLGEKTDDELKGVVRRFQWRVMVLPKGVGLCERYWLDRAAEEADLVRHISWRRALVAAHV